LQGKKAAAAQSVEDVRKVLAVLDQKIEQKKCFCAVLAKRAKSIVATHQGIIWEYGDIQFHNLATRMTWFPTSWREHRLQSWGML
jgi:phage gp16-like protein